MQYTFSKQAIIIKSESSSRTKENYGYLIDTFTCLIEVKSIIFYWTTTKILPQTFWNSPLLEKLESYSGFLALKAKIIIVPQTKKQKSNEKDERTSIKGNGRWNKISKL